MTTARERREAAIARHQEEVKALKLRNAIDDAQEKERQRKADVRMKAVLGGAVLAAIRNGRLNLAVLKEAIEPALREQDHKALSPLFTTKV